MRDAGHRVDREQSSTNESARILDQSSQPWTMAVYTKWRGRLSGHWDPARPVRPVERGTARRPGPRTPAFACVLREALLSSHGGRERHGHGFRGQLGDRPTQRSPVTPPPPRYCHDHRRSRQQLVHSADDPDRTQLQAAGTARPNASLEAKLQRTSSRRTGHDGGRATATQQRRSRRPDRWSGR